MTTLIQIEQIAPCGITCAACRAHLRQRKPCPGCRFDGPGKPAHCQNCKIEACTAAQGIQFCFACPTFPCDWIKHIDKRYRLRYHLSLEDQLIHLKAVGPARYLSEETARWTCPDCGGVICLHDQFCSECGNEAS